METLFDRKWQELRLRVIILDNQTNLSSKLPAVTVPSMSQSTVSYLQNIFQQENLRYHFLHWNLLHWIDLSHNSNLNSPKLTAAILPSMSQLMLLYFGFWLSNIAFGSSERKPDPGYCQELHICMNRVDKQTRFFSKQPSLFLLSCCLSANSHRQNIVQW